jgi:hypothetical protein
LNVLLIHPPVAKPSEPPAGIARLQAALRAHGIDCNIWDANLEGMLALLAHPLEGGDRWSRRAIANTADNLAALRGRAIYTVRDRYQKAVREINHRLYLAGAPSGVTLSLANYEAPPLSPVRSADLLAAAADYGRNPFAPYWQRHLAALCATAAPAIVGISLNFLSQALCAFALIGMIRALLPGVRIVVGGGLVTSWRQIPGFRNPFQGLVDDLVAGPGEGALLGICGVAGPADTDRPAADFSCLPWPNYLAPAPILPISASQGCYWRSCAFCPERAEGGAYRPYPTQPFLSEMRTQIQTIAPGLVHFLDNALAPRLMQALSASPPGIPWYGFVRITRHLADADFAAALRAAGCVMLKLGVESGDQAVLDALNKGVDLDVVSRALTTLKKAGIATYVYLLFGTPAEDEACARRTLDFTAAHAGAIDFLNLAIFNLPVGSPEAETLATSDFYAGDLSLYKEFQHPRGWHRGHVRRFLTKVFRRHPAVRPILAQDPPYFTSNHAALLLPATLNRPGRTPESRTRTRCG